MFLGNWYIVGFEDGFDVFGDFGIDIIIRDEGDGVFVIVFGGFEDIGLKGLGGGVLDIGEVVCNVEVLVGLSGSFEKVLFVERKVVSMRMVGGGEVG